MPHFPERLTITNVSADVINAILNSGSIDYRSYIPQETTQDVDSIREVGAIIMDSPNLRNAFATDLLNLVISVRVKSRSYESPTARLKKGELTHGETIEDVFVGLIEAELYDPNASETTVFRRHFPDIKAAFYVTNYQVYYPISISNEQLRAAFRTADGVYNLIEKIYEQLYTSDAYDDFNMVKYMIAYHVTNGNIKAIPTPAPTTDANVRTGVRTIKATSNRMRFMTGDYNIVGVKTHVPHEEQTLIISADYDAAVDVDVLAAAFNMEKTEFLSKRLLIDSFGSIDVPRLAAVAPHLCTNIVKSTDPNGVEHVISADLKYLSADQLAALDTIPAVLIDDDFVQEYDVLQTMEDIRNPKGLYTNAFYHVWRKYAVSPFAPTAVFDTTTGAGVTAITLTPATVDTTAGSSINIRAAVSAVGFVDQSVKYSISGANSPDTVIDAAGNLHIAAEETATNITVTATANADNTVTASATVRVLTGDYAITYAGTAAVTGPASAIAGTLVEATRNIGSTSSASGFTITVKQGNTTIPHTASVTGSSSSHVLHVVFTMPHGAATVTVTTA